MGYGKDDGNSKNQLKIKKVDIESKGREIRMRNYIPKMSIPIEK